MEGFVINQSGAEWDLEPGLSNLRVRLIMTSHSFFPDDDRTVSKGHCGTVFWREVMNMPKETSVNTKNPDS